MYRLASFALLLKASQALPNAPGSCNSPNPLGFTHVTTAFIGGTNLIDYGLEVRIGGIALDITTSFDFPIDEDVSIELLSTTGDVFRGALLKLYKTKIDTTAFLSTTDSNAATPQLCTVINAGGIGHTNNNEKTSIGGTIFVDEPMDGLILEVTSVIRNGASAPGSEWYLSRFALNAVSNMTFAPTTSVVATRAPITSAPVTSTPINDAPVTSAPVSSAPVGMTDAPVTGAPATSAPVDIISVTSAPVTMSPVAMTEAPVTTVPVTITTGAPVTTAPVPGTMSPVTMSPVTMAPIIMAPVAPFVSPIGFPPPIAPTTVAPFTTPSVAVTMTPVTMAPLSGVASIPSSVPSDVPSIGSPTEPTPLPTVPFTLAPVADISGAATASMVVSLFAGAIVAAMWM